MAFWVSLRDSYSIRELHCTSLRVSEADVKVYMDRVIGDGSGQGRTRKSDGFFTEPEATLQWVVEARSETDQRGMMPEMVVNWVQRDANAAFGWVGRQAPSPLRDTSIAELVTKGTNLDRASAEGWAREIQDQALRERTLQELRKTNR